MAQEKGWKGRESRERLLVIAAEEFAGRGFHETKISTIVARAGLTQPSFYLYFSSKEAIFQELVNDFRTRLYKTLEEIRLTPGAKTHDVPHRVLEAVQTVFRFLVATPHLTRIGLFLAPEADEIKGQMLSLVTSNLKAEQQAGYFRSDFEMGTVAECLLGMVERLTLSQLLTGVREPESLAMQVVNLLMYGMVGNEGT